MRPAVLSVDQGRAAAATSVLADDGFSIGVLYRGERAVVVPPLQPQISVTDIEREFALGAEMAGFSDTR